MLVCSFALSRVWFGPGENTILSKGAFRIIVLVFFFEILLNILDFVVKESRLQPGSRMDGRETKKYDSD
jgi:hypothetical protein